MNLVDIKSLEEKLDSVYLQYFTWFKKKKLFLKEGIQTSHPFFIKIKSQLGTKCNKINRNNIILIYGQETYGYPGKNWVNHPELVNYKIKEIFTNKNSYQDALTINHICSIGYDFPEFKKESVTKFDSDNNININAHFTGPFWNLLRNISNSNYSILWSNIVKFDIYRPINSKRRIKKSEILKEQKTAVYKVHRDLIYNEIEIIKPGKVLFLSSPTEEKSIYNEIIAELLEFDDKIEENFMRKGKIISLNIPFIQSFHPRRLNLEERKKLIKHL